ncbi:hypothetical protein BC831DRAFT_273721 [Entophlyctis helioformis]|nr:hypothetical protein BC831DRAFT_273721 [Entophlyctis helioformis]
MPVYACLQLSETNGTCTRRQTLERDGDRGGRDERRREERAQMNASVDPWITGSVVHVVDGQTGAKLLVDLFQVSDHLGLLPRVMAHLLRFGVAGCVGVLGRADAWLGAGRRAAAAAGAGALAGMGECWPVRSSQCQPVPTSDRQRASASQCQPARSLGNHNGRRRSQRRSQRRLTKWWPPS